MQTVIPRVTGALLVLCCCAFAATLPSNSSSTYLKPGSITPLSAIPDLPDDDFSFVIEWYRSALVEVPSIMVCTWAMRELAMLHFEDDSIPERDWTHPRFPQVRLTVVPPANENDLSVRFAMWVITATMRLMLEAEGFQSIRFHGFFRNKAIGSAVLTPSSDTDVLYSSKFHLVSPSKHENPPDTRTIFPFGNVSMRANATFRTNDQLHADLTYLSTVIDRRDIFFAVIWLILECAPHNQEPLTVWRVTRAIISSQITTIWNRVRQTQCQMTMGDMISFLAYLPEVLLREGMFREMDITIKDGDVVVARGSFRAQRIRHLMELSSNSNVTTS